MDAVVFADATIFVVEAKGWSGCRTAATASRSPSAQR
jgi:hypothetical protein